MILDKLLNQKQLTFKDSYVILYVTLTIKAFEGGTLWKH